MDPDQLVTAVLPGLKNYIHVEAETTRAAALAEIDKKAEEAKQRALLGGFAAGAVGVGLGLLLGYAIGKRRR